MRQRRAAASGLRLAQAACVAGLAYAAISVYWALGGTWLLDTIGGTLEQQGRAGNPGIIMAVWAAAVLKIIGAIVPLAAAGVTPGQATTARRRRVRVLAWLEAAILTVYGLALTGAGLLVQSGAIASAASAGAVSVMLGERPGQIRTRLIWVIGRVRFKPALASDGRQGPCRGALA